MTKNTNSFIREAKASDEYVAEIQAALAKRGGRKMTAKEQTQRLSLILNSGTQAEAMKRLGQSMIGPIQLKLRYQGLVRNVLMEVAMQPGEPLMFDVLDDTGQAYVLNATSGEVKITPFEGKRVQLIADRIAAFPQIEKSELYYLRANIVEHAQDESRQAIQKQEDSRLLALIEAAVQGYAANNPLAAGGNTSIINVTGKLTPGALYDAIANVEERELTATRLLMNPRTFRDMYGWTVEQTGWTFKDNLVAGEKITSFGEFQIQTSIMIPKNTVYLTPDPEYLGVMPVLYSLDVVENPKPEAFELGWVMDEMIAMAILNARGLVKITTTE